MEQLVSLPAQGMSCRVCNYIVWMLYCIMVDYYDYKTLNLGILHNHIPVFKNDYNNNVYWDTYGYPVFFLLIARNNFSTNY